MQEETIVCNQGLPICMLKWNWRVISLPPTEMELREGPASYKPFMHYKTFLKLVKTFFQSQSKWNEGKYLLAIVSSWSWGEMATPSRIGTVPEDKKTLSHHCEGKTRKSTQSDEKYSYSSSVNVFASSRLTQSLSPEEKPISTLAASYINR